MSIASYPLVIWPHGDRQYVGQILGTPYSVVDESRSALSASATDYLNKAFKLHGIIEPPEIDDPVLKIYDVSVQLVYREKSAVYPLPGSNRIAVAAVHENNRKQGYSECYLPLFEKSFYYHEPSQLRTLLEHTVRQTLENSSPEDAFQYLMATEPALSEVKVRMSEEQQAAFSLDAEAPRLLLEISDSVPPRTKTRKSKSRLPQVAWEREQLVNRLARSLIDDKDNIVLVGESGVGKTTIWNDAIKILARETRGQENAPTVWRTTSQRLISKAKYLGEWQENCDETVESLGLVNGILWVSDLANLAYEGGESAEVSVAAYLQSYIAKGQLRLIGEMQPAQLDALRARLPGFLQYFESVPVVELDSGRAYQVLGNYVSYARTNYGIKVQDDTRDLAFQLVERFIRYESSPGNHVRFFGECLKQSLESGRSEISREDLIDAFSRYTALSDSFMRDDIKLDQSELLSFFSSRIIGQKHVLEQLCNIVHTFKAGLNDPEKPVATLLFAGPTGVGKTEATKALSQYFFETGQRHQPLFRLDMSEFQHAGHMDRIIGSLRSPGKLITHVRSNPFSVILLDEIEKAHESVFDALLTLFDEGKLTDRSGRVTDFRSSIIVMTSNLGANASSGPGFFRSDVSQVSHSAIRKYFRPEFYNRIDEVLTFNPLSREAIVDIAHLEIAKIRQRDRIKDAGIDVSFSDELVEYIAEVGFNAVYGARPLQRAIEKHVVRAISNYLLESKSSRKIRVEFDDDEVLIRTT